MADNSTQLHASERKKSEVSSTPTPKNARASVSASLGHPGCALRSSTATWASSIDVLVPCVAALPTRMTGTWLSALPVLASYKHVPTQITTRQALLASFRPACPHRLEVALRDMQAASALLMVVEDACLESCSKEYF